MRRLIDSFINLILLLLAIIIVIVTIYFCLDVFEIIDVPENLSIANLFYSKIEVMSVGESLLPLNIIDDSNGSIENKPKIVVDRGDGSVEDYTTRRDTLERLQALQEKYNEENPDSSKDEKIAVTNSDKLYYSQLDTYGKQIYDKLYNNKDKLKTGTYTADFDTQFNDLLHDEENGTTILNNAFQLAINALTFDNPELFYVDVTKMYLLTEITTRAFSRTYRVSIGGNGSSYLFNEFNTADGVYTAISNVELTKKNLINSCSDKDTIEKIRTVHDYLVDNIEYDSTYDSNVYNIYGALANGKCVCEGYARAFKYILDDMDIPCVIACGIGRNSEGATESHAWNYVELDGIWYAIDCTWDDPVIRGGSGYIAESRRYTYFLKGSDTIFRDHFEDGNIVGTFNFKYPELSKTDY